MASVARFSIVGSSLRKSGCKLPLTNLQSIRTISTSKKNRETAAVNPTAAATKQKTEDVSEEKNWISYGFNEQNKKRDRNWMHSSTFFSVTVCLVFGSFVYAYQPDYKLRDWAQREAYMELRRREKLGLPLIDPNLVKPSKVKLPSEEELGDTEIII